MRGSSGKNEKEKKSHITVFLDSYMHLRSHCKAAGRLVVSVLQHPLLAGDVCYTACTRFDLGILFLPLLNSLPKNNYISHVDEKKLAQMCWHVKIVISFYQDGGIITPSPSRLRGV